MRRLLILLLLLAAPLFAGKQPSSCTQCAAWNTPERGFRIYGNSYYVGTHGLSAILITSDQGHVLIDAALPESVPHIVANIKALGFRVEDIKLIVNSHIHFDHGGGIAKLQKLSGARVAALPWSADAMQKGLLPKDDPQFGTIVPSPRIAHVERLHDGQTLRVGAIAVTAHFTPGHTPGGTSWTWQSCESARCLQLVYADSVSAVSADGFRYSDRAQYRHGEDFEGSFSFLESAPCDILITPHPEASDLWKRLDQRAVKPDALVDPAACRSLAENARERLKQRLAAESAK